MTSEKKFEKLYCDKSKKYNDLKSNNKELQEEAEFYKNLNTEILETSAKPARSRIIRNILSRKSNSEAEIMKLSAHWMTASILWTEIWTSETMTGAPRVVQRKSAPSF